MKLFNMLSFFFEDGASAEDIVTWVSIGALAALVVILVVLCLTYKKMNTKAVVFAAVCIACSFILSFIKVSPVPFGGSITLASLVPLFIYAYVYGPVRGLAAGLIYGILQFIQDPYLLTPLTFILDFILAFAGVFLIGLSRKIFKKEITAVCSGAAFAYLWRFVMHFVSGLLYFELGVVNDALPASSAALYSFLYQIVYLLPDMAITIGVLLTLLLTKNFKRLVVIIRPDFYACPAATAIETGKTD